MAPSKPTTSCRKRKKSPIQSPKNKVAKKSAADPTDANKKENGRGLKDTLHGVIYQLKLLMLFSYCCNFADYSFKLYTEMAAAGKFDDVVLEYSINNVLGYIFLQAKHSLNVNNKITCANLKAKKDRFFLNKYFTSYVKIKRNDRFKNGHKHFMINTNLGFKFDQKSDKIGLEKLGKLYFESYDISSNINKSNKIFDLFYGDGKYYKLKDSVETLESWFGQTTDFKILAELLAECLVNKKKIDFNQTMFKAYHSVLVGEIIDCKNEKLADNFIKNENLSSDALTFRNAVLQDVEETHKKKITDFLREMASNGSLDLSINFKEEPESNNKPIFPEQKVSVEDVEGFMNDCIFAVNQPNEKKIGEEIHQKIGQGFSLVSSDLASDRYLKKILDWFKEKRSVPLTQFDIRTILENTDVEITTIESSGQTILLIDRLRDYGLKFKKESIDVELLNFVKSSDQAAQKRICILQNSDTIIGSLKVNQALQESSKINDGFIFITLTDLLLEQKMVMKTLKNEKMRLLIVVCETKVKNVTEICKLLSKHLQNSNQRLLLIGSEEHPLIESFLSPNLSFVVKQENRFSDFTSESQKTLLKKEVTFQGHEIALEQLVDDQQENIINLMLKSGLLENKTQELGNEIPISIGYKTVYYIDRNFQKETEVEEKPDVISSQDLLDQLKEDTHKKFILITDTAGMGKSTVLTHLSLEIKKANPHFWVVRIDLNANTEAFIKHTKKLTSHNVVEFIVDNLLNLETKLEINLFKYLLQERKVVLMLDAFDEIRPSYEKKGIEFFESFKEINLRQIWITTRPYLKNEQKPELSLDELFPGDQVDSLAITPFSKKNQEEFLQKFWSQNRNFDQPHLETYAANLIYKLKQSIGYNENFTSIPLHLLMIAKVYEPDENSIEKLLFEWKIKIDLFFLYQQFSDTKIDINLGKGATSKHNDSKTEQKNAYKGEINLWKAYEHSAIELIFPNQSKDILKYIERETVSSEELFRSGIVVTTNGSIKFVHRTFAEYFAVQFIMKQLTEAHPNEFLQGFFLKTILSESTNYEMIRKFLNSFIEQSYQKDSKIGRLKDMGELIKEACNEQVINQDSFSILDIAAREKNSNIIKFLSDNLNVENCYDFRKSLIKCFMRKKNRHLFYDYYEYIKGDSQVVDELFAWIENCFFSIDKDPLVEPDVDGFSLWACAIINSYKPILKKIWDYCKNGKKYSDADLKTKLLLSKCDGEYSLFTALSKNYLNILKYLWRFAEEIDAQKELFQCQNKDGQTLMQVMIFRSFGRDVINEAAKLFLELCNFYNEDLSLKLTLKFRSYYTEDCLVFKSILCFVASFGDTETVDEIWRIAKEILKQNQLKTLLMETSRYGNKTWQLVALQCEDSPLKKAKELGMDVGLGDELHQKLLKIQDRPDVVKLKKKLLTESRSYR